jgi:chromosome segregation ATPase
MLGRIGIPVEKADEYMRAYLEDLDDRLRRASSLRRECHHQEGVALKKLSEARALALSPRTRNPERHQQTIVKLERRLASWEVQRAKAERDLGVVLREVHKAFGSPPFGIEQTAMPWDAPDWKPF